MNHGLNLGLDVFYSGTVAAAREAALRGVPSVAVSADTRADRDAAARFGASIAREVLSAVSGRSGESGLLFNVNVPPGSSWSVRPTKLGRRNYAGDVLFRHDPRGGEYMWIGGGTVTHHEAPGSDTEAYDEGVVGITPLALHLDLASGMPAAAAVARAVSIGS
jgi:5'-nucleotidase